MSRKPNLLAPLRGIDGWYSHPHPAAGGIVLALDCGHKVKASRSAKDQQRARCVKCRDERERARFRKR